MPAEVVEQWYRSGQSCSIAGCPLVPIRYPRFDMVVCAERGQGEAYWLQEWGAPMWGGRRWILKKFRPSMQPTATYVARIGRCIPPYGGFESGTDRIVVTESDVAPASASDALLQWLAGTILMPMVCGEPWGSLIGRLIDGHEMPFEQRVRTALGLVEAVARLEVYDVSHRDLSAANILVDGERIHLIDWDTMYHSSLPFEPNTTVGSSGYIAPWVANDVRRSWRSLADRYSLSVCVAEILAASPSLVCHGNGGLLDQGGGGHPSKTSVNALFQALRGYPAVADLFAAAMGARGFSQCPGPADWRVGLQGLILPRVALTAIQSAQPVRYGCWTLMRHGPRLCIRHNTSRLAIELNLHGLGSFRFRHEMDQGTMFADGSFSRLGHFLVQWPSSTGARTPRWALDEEPADLHNYRFTFSKGGLCMQNRINEHIIEIERDGPTRILVHAADGTQRMFGSECAS